MTSNLQARVYEHQNNKYANSFTAKFNIHRLVYFETFHSIEEAIAREKQIKAGSRKKKEALINGTNSEWKDLTSEVNGW